MTVGGGGQ